jgi:hypothetical protein
MGGKGCVRKYLFVRMILGEARRLGSNTRMRSRRSMMLSESRPDSADRRVLV